MQKSVEAVNFLDESQEFWIEVWVAFAAILTWLIIGVLHKLTDLHGSEDAIEALLGYFKIFESYLGDIGFVPVCAILLNMFMCSKEVGTSFSETVLDSDCDILCWRDEHFVYACIAAGLLIFYIRSVVIVRPMLHSNFPSLHVVSTSKWLLSKSVF